MKHMTQQKTAFLLASVVLALFQFSLFSQAEPLPPGASPQHTLPDQKRSFPQSTTPVVDTSEPRAPSLEIPDDAVIRLQNISFYGVTVYDRQELLGLYEKLVGQEIHLSELYGIANHLTARYHRDGYLLSQAFVPQQTITNGEVQIWVTEGAIKTFHVTGSDYDSSGMMEKYVQRIMASRPLHRSVLERNLLLINDLPGITAQSYIIPGENGLQDAELVLNIAYRKLAGYIGADNRGSKFFGRDQVYASVELNNVLGLGERIELTPTMSGVVDQESIGGSINTTIPIHANGTYLQVYVAGSETKPGGFLTPYELEGEALFGSLALGYPLIRETNKYLYLTGELDYVKAEEDIYKDQAFIKDAQTAFRAGLVFHQAGVFNGDTYAELKVSFGVDGLGTRDADHPLSSRENADNSFVKMQVSATRRQSLASLAENLNLVIGLEGQYSATPLPSSEEYGLGGAVFLRGYDNYELSGDNAVASRVELQYDHKAIQIQPLHALESFAFYDYGKIWNRSPLDFEEDNRSIASAGLGVRANLTRRTFASFYLAKPLTKDVISNRDDNLRCFFQLAMSF